MTMTRRDDRIYEEAAALWQQLHGQPPPAGVDGATVLNMVLGDLPEAGYERLSMPHLRPANIAFPQRRST